MSRDHHLIHMALCSFQGTASVCHAKWIIDTVVCEIAIQLFPHVPVSKATLNKSTSISGFKMICDDSVVNEYNQIVSLHLRPEDEVVCLQLFQCCHHRYYFLELGVTPVIQVKSSHH